MLPESSSWDVKAGAGLDPVGIVRLVIRAEQTKLQFRIFGGASFEFVDQVTRVHIGAEVPEPAGERP
jgi:hypothetical protein